MKKVIYASRVLPGKETFLRETFACKRQSPPNPATEREWAELIGMHDWRCWLQTLQGEHYFIHYLELDDPKHTYAELRRQIAKGHPIAKGIHQRYLKALGKDYLDPATEPRLTPFYELQVEPWSELNKRAFAFPLKLERIAAHRAYCDLCVGERRGEFLEMLHANGVKDYGKYLQETEEGPLLIVYEGIGGETRPCTLPSWIKGQLALDTGLPAEAFDPILERLDA